MEVIYGLIPGMILLGLIAVGVLFWAARSGQFNDLEGDAQRILMDEDDLQEKRPCEPESSENNEVAKQGDEKTEGDAPSSP